MNIIIIDDEPKIRKGMSKMLSLHPGWCVVSACADAESALRFLYENHVDVIITDIQMPGMQGLDMIERIRRVNPEIPVIILSGYNRFDYAQRAIELGVRKYITKPTSPDEINQAVQQIEDELRLRIRSIQTRVKPIAGIRQTENLLILRAIEYMEGHFQEKLSLKEVAGVLFISPNYLSELFKKTTGVKFSEYLSDLRMEESKRCLLDVRYKVGEVSRLVGFSDARYFSSAFRRKYHMTPLAFRNKYAAAGPRNGETGPGRDET